MRITDDFAEVLLRNLESSTPLSAWTARHYLAEALMDRAEWMREREQLREQLRIEIASGDLSDAKLRKLEAEDEERRERLGCPPDCPLPKWERMMGDFWAQNGGQA